MSFGSTPNPCKGNVTPPPQVKRVRGNPMSNEPLRARLRGEVIEPSDVRYDAARRVYNAMFDRHPRVIARCADVADVMACVEFARENSIMTAVRGGGHNAAGLGVCDDGLVIDL